MEQGEELLQQHLPSASARTLLMLMLMLMLAATITAWTWGNFPKKLCSSFGKFSFLHGYVLAELC